MSGFEWASAQMPINVLDAHYRSFQTQVVPKCVARGIGVIGMKALAGGSPKGRIPERGLATAVECRRYALSLEVSSLVCGILSGHRWRAYARKAFAAGANGYVLKGDPVEIESAMRTMLAGERYVTQSLAEDG